MREKEGDLEGRPLIVTMSFQPVIPQRVARQQSPPLLCRPGNILQVEPAARTVQIFERFENRTGYRQNTALICRVLLAVPRDAKMA
jgi:hypothetical protein